MKTTKKHFELFVKECKKTVADLGLTGWDITYEHRNLNGSLAQCWTRVPEAQATISIGTDWPGYIKITSEDIRLTANHEVCHLLVARMANIGACRYISESELKEADEEVANRLVNYMRKHKCI